MPPLLLLLEEQIKDSRSCHLFCETSLQRVSLNHTALVQILLVKFQRRYIEATDRGQDQQETLNG